MRDEKVNSGRVKSDQCLIRRDRVVQDIYRAQNPQEQVPVFIRTQPVNCTDHLIVAAGTVCVTTMPVVAGAIAVQRDSHSHTRRGEEVAKRVVKPHAVGMDPDVEPAHAVKLGVQCVNDAPKRTHASKERLSAVKSHMGTWQPMLSSVLSYARANLSGSLLGHHLRAGVPARVVTEVDIAVITG